MTSAMIAGMNPTAQVNSTTSEPMPRTPTATAPDAFGRAGSAEGGG
jgi:hypothetical protein